MATRLVARTAVCGLWLVLLASASPALGAAGDTTRVSVATGGAEGNEHVTSGYLGAEVSADGRFVAFASPATNLVAGDTNAAQDVFVHDRQTGTTGG